jgi:hypothetical protein
MTRSAEKTQDEQCEVLSLIGDVAVGQGRAKQPLLTVARR